MRVGHADVGGVRPLHRRNNPYRREDPVSWEDPGLWDDPYSG